MRWLQIHLFHLLQLSKESFWYLRVASLRSSSDASPFTGGVTWVHPSIGCVTELFAPYKQVVVETKGREENAQKNRTKGNTSRLK